MAALWTQEEAINFECARETITHLMALLTSDIAAEEGKPSPSRVLLDGLRKRRFDLALERRALGVHDHQKIETIFNVYGPMVRNYQAGDALKVA